MNRFCLSFALGIFVFSLNSIAFASVLTTQENSSYFGTLDQHSLDYSYPQYGLGANNMACGPVAAVNSLVYLDNAFSSIYGTSLVLLANHDMNNDGLYNTYDDWIYSAGVMAGTSYMNTTLANGTWHDNFIWGMYNFVNSKANGKETFSALDYWSSWGNSPAPNSRPSWVSGGLPTWDFLYSKLNSSAAVDILFTYVGGGGHFVSVTGMTWDNLNNSGTLNFMNPWTGANGSTAIRLTSGKIYTDYGGSNGSWISEINAITPIPEPSIYALLGIGAIGILMVTRRNKDV